MDSSFLSLPPVDGQASVEEESIRKSSSKTMRSTISLSVLLFGWIADEWLSLPWRATNLDC